VASGDVERLWLDMLGRLSDAVAHELKNPLNGAMLNLEVVRQRAARQGADAASLVPFAEFAATELARAGELAEALLALARPLPEPVDLWAVLEPLTVVSRATARATGGTISVTREGDRTGGCNAPAAAVRLALGAALHVSVDVPAMVICTVGGGGGGSRVRVTGGAAVSSTVRAAVGEHGIVCSADEGSRSLTIHFPALARGRIGVG
jgi:signal transduction histidine kinase